MDRAEFEASLRQEGYEVREGEIEPHGHREAHAHDFDARILVLDGSITLVFGTERVTYRPGDSCNVPPAQCTRNTLKPTVRGTWRAAAHRKRHRPPSKWHCDEAAAFRSRLRLRSGLQPAPQRFDCPSVFVCGQRSCSILHI